jgi:hypothetical protein
MSPTLMRTRYCFRGHALVRESPGPNFPPSLPSSCAQYRISPVGYGCADSVLEAITELGAWFVALANFLVGRGECASGGGGA